MAEDRTKTRGGARHRGENILVVQTSFIGDVVLTHPLLAALKTAFSNCTLTVLCTPVVKELVTADPRVDEVLVYDKRGDARGLRGLWHVARQLRQRGYTIAIASHKSLRTALLLWLARIPLRIGFRQSPGWFLYHRGVRRDPQQHEVLRNLSLLRTLGVDPKSLNPDLELTVAPEQRSSVACKFEALGLAEGQGPTRVGINPGSVWTTKRWTIAGYAALVTMLKAKYQCEVLIFGGPDDAATTGAIQRACGNTAIDLTNRFTLAELPAALERCDVLISGDSAPMHMAVARGVPVVAIFCATTPSLGFYPFSDSSVVVQKGLHCRPCGSHGGRRCPLGTDACIEGVGVGAVMAAVQRVLASRDKEPCYSYTPEFVTI